MTAGPFEDDDQVDQSSLVSPLPDHACSPSATRPEATEARFALLIGNGRYPNANLNNPVCDVRLLAQVLTSLGFTVTTIENATQSQMQDALAQFYARIDGAGSNTAAFIYFAGHAFQDHGTNFLLPAGVSLPSNARLPARAIAVDDIVASVARTKRKINVLVLDACRKFPIGAMSPSQDMRQGLASLKLPPAGMLVVYSTAAGTTAQDGKNQPNSPYATALAQSLPGLLDHGKRVHDVFVEAADRVRDASGNEQNPALYLQGSLPPLQVTEVDRERFRTFVFHKPKTWRERTFQGIGTAAVALLIAGGGLAWWSAYPETRSRWLHASGIIRNADLAFSCNQSQATPDRFGLTWQQWCLLPPGELLRTAFNEKRWNSVSDPERAAAGDIAAMTLTAVREAGPENLFERFRKQAEAAGPSLALRAARAGWLPAWTAVAQFARMSRLTLSKHELRSGLEAASSAGVVPSQIELGTALWASGNIVAAEKLFEQAVATDTTGLAALTIGDLFHHGSPAAKFPADAIRAAKEFTTACRQGQPTGLLRLNDSRTANLTPSTDTGLRDCVALADTPGSPLARMLEHSTAGMLMLAKLHRDNTLSGISKPERALYWTGKVAATGNPAARLELAKTLAWGIPDPAGKPQLPLDLDRAHAIFQRLIHDGRFTPSAPEKDSAIDALLELAILYERGTFGTGGVYEALSLLSKFPELSSTGRAHDYVAQLRQRYSTLEGLRKSALAPEDTLNIGDAKAPILITTMASWGCAICTDFFRRVLPDVEANYAKQGLARIEVRLKSPVKFGSLSAAVGSAMLCVPNEHRLTFYAAVFEGTAALMAMSEDDRRASIWRIAQSVPPGTTCSPDGTPPPAAPDWPSQFRPPGDSPSSLSANGNLLENRAQDAVRWGISDFPIVFVNGQRLENPDIETLRRTIYDFTRPQDRSALTKP